jgi:hypothetical protein
VNTGFPIAPPSIGVATFDGLNKNGYPYNPTLANLQLSYKADTLTSRPINLKVTATSQTLQPTDNVALSFYYQIGGRGDYPESSDSLVLDFYNPTQRSWSNAVWSKAGPNNPNYNDTIFKRVFLWIKNTDFLKDSFQFRFRNYATTNGDFDHWNIDYIYLDKNRDSILDTAYYDIAFAGMPGPFLKNYSAMPHEQYTPGEMASNASVRIRNNYFQSVSFSYNYNMLYDKTNNLVSSYVDNYTVAPFNSSGYVNIQTISNPQIGKAFSNVDQNLDFPIRHAVSLAGGSGQFFDGNDTLIQYQRLRNYYAFDDGAAEAGYYILGTGGKMAVKIYLNNPDEILGARIYFANVGNISLTQSFSLCVWASTGFSPGNLILSDTFQVKYKNYGFKEVPEYTLRVPQSLRTLQPGTYFVGFKQGVQSGINVGLDLNYDHHNSLYFDSGSGWTQSQIYGSVMIQPVFGSWNGIPMAIEESTIGEPKNSAVYPNPANDYLIIQTPHSKNAVLQVYNATGACVLQEPMPSEKHTAIISSLPDGVYFLRINDNGNTVYQQKIIISHR